MRRSTVREPSSLLKKPPGAGTGPTMRADFRGNLVGRVPSRGERHVVQQTAMHLAEEFTCEPFPSPTRWIIVQRELHRIIVNPG